MDDYVIDFDLLGYLKPETLDIIKLVVKKYNESKGDDVLQDGIVVGFDELAKAAKIQVDKLPDEVFKDLDAERDQFDEESKGDDVLQDGIVVGFDELAKAAKIQVDKLPDEVFKDLDAERDQFDEEKRSYEPLVASCLADEKAREFRIIINHRLFEF